jgi:asparagine synthase (glutamine-hydrolysing)
LRREGFFDAGQVRTRWQEHLSGRRDWQQALWNVLMFQAWLEQENEGREIVEIPGSGYPARATSL